MKLLKLKCPNCNADLEINSNLDKFTCNYCGTTSLLDKQEINLNIKGNVSNNKLQSEIQDLKDIYNNGNFSLAYSKANDLLEIYPSNQEIKDIFDKLKETEEIKENKELYREIIELSIITITAFISIIICYFLFFAY